MKKMKTEPPPCKNCGGDFYKDHTHIYHGEDVCDDGSGVYEPMETEFLGENDGN